MSERNYDRELGMIDAKINYLEKRFEKYEIDTAIKLREIKDQNDKLELGFQNHNKELKEEMNLKFTFIGEKIDGLKHESTFSKGFIKAFLIFGSIITFAVTILLKFLT